MPPPTSIHAWQHQSKLFAYYFEDISKEFRVATKILKWGPHQLQIQSEFCRWVPLDVSK